MSKYPLWVFKPNEPNMSTSINEQLEKLEKKAELTSGASWAKFPNIGDSIQGALITRRLAMSPTQQEQIIYVIKNEDGIFNVAFKSNYPIHKEFAGAVTGQVVKIKYSSSKPHKQKGFNAIKIYTVTTSPELIDESTKGFLEENGYELGASMPELIGIPEFEDAPATEEASSTDQAKPLGNSIPKV